MTPFLCLNFKGKVKLQPCFKFIYDTKQKIFLYSTKLLPKTLKKGSDKSEQSNLWLAVSHIFFFQLNRNGLHAKIKINKQIVNIYLYV